MKIGRDRLFQGHEWKSKLMNRLLDRNLVYQTSHGARLDEYLQEAERSSSPSPVYCGFDPTASSLHVGSLTQLIGLRHFSDAGHPAILLVGGATGRIGDPSGRRAERPAMESAERLANVQSLSAQLQRLWASLGDESSSNFPAQVLNNEDWMAPLSVLDFYDQVGRHARMGPMLSRDSVRSRMDGDGLSYLEFSYQLFQAYDFLHLARTHGCRLQLGGSDQWGNVMAGCELVHKSGAGEAYGVTLPLLTTASGEKLGKSAGNAIWLDSARTSPHALYQYFLNLADDSAPPLLQRLTFRPLEDVERVCTEHAQAPEKRLAQHALASSLVRMVHGPGGLAQATAAARAYTQRGHASVHEEKDLAALPSCTLPWKEARELPVAALLTRAGLTTSNRESRRAVEAGAVSVQGQVLSDPSAPIPSQLLVDRPAFVLLRVGKKNIHVIHFVEDPL